MTYDEIIQALRDGKKLTKENGYLKYTNVLTYRTHNVDYIYTNPQFNRLLAKLKNGKVVDYNLCILDVYWNEIVEYEELIEVDFAEAFKAYKEYKTVKSMVSGKYYEKGNNTWHIENHAKNEEIEGKWAIIKQ